jgi:hypothetical protein
MLNDMTVTSLEQLPTSAPTAPPRLPVWRELVRRPAAWYAAFALYAAAVALFSGLGQDHWWGIWAFGGYAVAAVLAFCWRSTAGRIAAIGASLAGALAGPSTWLVTYRPTTPDAAVVMRSGSLLLHHGNPYLNSTALTHGGWLAYNPYLPVMALFGVPRALGFPGMLGDSRLWLALATFGLLFAAFRVLGPRHATGCAATGRAATGRAAATAAFLLASPVLAFPLSMAITDPPVIALTCLAVALAVRRPAASDATVIAASAAMVIAVACAMKETSWPAAAVLTALAGARYGARAAVRFAATVLAVTAALIVICAPEVVRHVGELVRNTVAYPLGLTKAKSPARSPLPGHLLASLGPAGHLAAVSLLVLAMVSIAASLLIRPPATAKAAVMRISLALSLLFALCPATRWGYFAYPAALCGWLAMARLQVPNSIRLPTGRG